MTDADLVPYIDRMVSVTLIDGRVLNGRLIRGIASLVVNSQYAIQHDPPTGQVVRGESFDAIQFAEYIKDIRLLEA